MAVPDRLVLRAIYVLVAELRATTEPDTMICYCIVVKSIIIMMIIIFQKHLLCVRARSVCRIVVFLGSYCRGITSVFRSIAAFQSQCSCKASLSQIN